MPRATSESFWASASSSHRSRAAIRISVLPPARCSSGAQDGAPSLADALAGSLFGPPSSPGPPPFCRAMNWSVLVASGPAAGPPA
eukprot:1958667-Lingulodinium_polyedra.AAC.1